MSTHTRTEYYSIDSEEEDFVEESQTKDKSKSEKRPKHAGNRVMELEIDVTPAQRLREEFALPGSSNQLNEESREEVGSDFGRNDKVYQIIARKFIESNSHRDNTSMEHRREGRDTRVPMSMRPREQLGPLCREGWGNHLGQLMVGS